MNDSIRYFPTMVNWVGFRSVAINVNHTERKLSNSSYSFDQRIKLAMDVILSFSDKPLRLAVKLGLFISATSIFFALYNLFRYILGLVIVPGWTSLIVSMWFLAGIVIFVLGLVGLYVGKIFEKVKNRPMYLVSEKINF
jgi:dolichol-phosphate mannosyltransferase